MGHLIEVWSEVVDVDEAERFGDIGIDAPMYETKAVIDVDDVAVANTIPEKDGWLQLKTYDGTFYTIKLGYDEYFRIKAMGNKIHSYL